MDFLKNNRRFSFKLDGTDAWSLDCRSEVTCAGDTVTTVCRFPGGLQITNVAKKYEKFDAYEWVNYLENTSEQPTGILSELWDSDCTLPLAHEDDRKYCAYQPDPKTATKVYAPVGSVWSQTDFSCNVDTMRDARRPNHIYPGETKEYTASGGRSS